jgi:hypothetical protein
MSVVVRVRNAERYTWGTKTIMALGVKGSGFFNNERQTWRERD